MEKIKLLVKKALETLCFMITVAEELVDSNPFKVFVFILCLHFAPDWLGLRNNFGGLVFNNLFFQFALYLGLFVALEFLSYCLERLANFFSDWVLSSRVPSARNIPEKATGLLDRNRAITSTSLSKISES